MENHSTCYGDYPESYTGDYQKKTQDCKLNTQIIPRNASSVFVAEVLTAISTPEEANLFYNVLNYNPVFNNLFKMVEQNIPWNFNNIKNQLNELVINGINDAIPYSDQLNKLTSAQENDAQRLIDHFKNIISNKSPISDEEFRIQEFNTFSNPSNAIKLGSNLILGKEALIKYSGLKFKVVAIPKLEVVMVQEGYQRLCYYNVMGNESPIPRKVRTPYIDNAGYNWYPSVKLYGEGLFITLEDNSVLQWNKENLEEWYKLFKNIKKYNNEFSKEDDLEYESSLNENENEILQDKNQNKPIKTKINEKQNTVIDPNDIVWQIIKEDYESSSDQINDDKGRDEVIKKFKAWFKKFLIRKLGSISHPIGIWWHTLAHRLIKAISLNSGYSSSAIRERIYFDSSKNIGGILIYACQPGEDGTLGGLVGQINSLDSIFTNALDDIDFCSNDPMCIDHIFKPWDTNGAACYACLFLSETSCEFGNIGLDRQLLINILK
jgi:hypothetical protein